MPFWVSHQCYFCGTWAPCFIVFPMLQSGCLPCLLEGRFGFDHQTEIGWVDEHGLTPDHVHYQAWPDGFRADAWERMRLTPPFSSWHEPFWLVHCHDFMTYHGLWQPYNFVDAAGSLAAARDLFIRMTWMGRYEDRAEEVWDRLFALPETTLAHWDVSYYVFECTTCGCKRGYFDFP